MLVLVFLLGTKTAYFLSRLEERLFDFSQCASFFVNLKISDALVANQKKI